MTGRVYLRPTGRKTCHVTFLALLKERSKWGFSEVFEPAGNPSNRNATEGRFQRCREVLFVPEPRLRPADRGTMSRNLILLKTTCSYAVPVAGNARPHGACDSSEYCA